MARQRKQSAAKTNVANPNDKRNFRRFERWSDFIEHTDVMPANAQARAKNGSTWSSWSECVGADASEGMEFYGTRSKHDADELMRKGWTDGTRRVMELRSELNDLVQAASVAKSRTHGWSQSGEWLHIGRAIQGRPDCFCRTFDMHNDAAGRVVTVVQNASCSATVSERTIFKRGAVTLCLVDILETLGHRVELLYGTCAERTDEPGVFDEFHAVAKAPGEQLDIDRLSFFFCHRSGLRRYCFNVYERFGRMYGGMPRAMRRTLEENRGCVMIPEIHSYTEPKDAVMECMQAAGITIDFANK